MTNPEASAALRKLLRICQKPDQTKTKLLWGDGLELQGRVQIPGRVLNSARAGRGGGLSDVAEETRAANGTPIRLSGPASCSWGGVATAFGPTRLGARARAAAPPRCPLSLVCLLCILRCWELGQGLSWSWSSLD